jgi:hypothetical protein
LRQTPEQGFVQGRDGRDARDVSIIAAGSNESKGGCNEKKRSKRATSSRAGKRESTNTKKQDGACCPTHGHCHVKWCGTHPSLHISVDLAHVWVGRDHRDYHRRARSSLCWRRRHFRTRGSKTLGCCRRHVKHCDGAPGLWTPKMRGLFWYVSQKRQMPNRADERVGQGAATTCTQD